jgi:hypothetical protein
MRQGTEIRSGVRPHASFLVILTLMVGTQTACSKQTAPEQTSSQEPQRPAVAISKAAPIAPPCPPFGSFTAPTEPEVKGEHKVILSWIASAPADAKHEEAVGYCVYRGTKRKDQSVVLISPVAIQGTSCTDDMVATGKTYYYKVKAISIGQHTSDATDFVSANILNQKPINPVLSLPPVCRGLEKSK